MIVKELYRSEIGGSLSTDDLNTAEVFSNELFGDFSYNF
jgi:hypothetical protein